jgi:hypothetical protein
VIAPARLRLRLIWVRPRLRPEAAPNFKLRAAPAPRAETVVHPRSTMSIEKESSGIPEFNPHKRTTKVNFGIVIGVAIFFAAMGGMFWWFATHRP